MTYCQQKNYVYEFWVSEAEEEKTAPDDQDIMLQDTVGILDKKKNDWHWFWFLLADGNLNKDISRMAFGCTLEKRVR